ncbi:MAG: methionine--tRNA ligase [Deltaproteobacteria bacterium]|nr:MAG: methionine--tRNA ligase [Deltaproteobacteria bacterium]
MNRFYVTTPIYYVNDVPHIGHCFTTIVADTLARYHRLAGDETFFLTGTDEHGEKIAEAAALRDTTPQAVADEYSQRFRATWEALGFSFDRFIRTTDPDHVRNVQAVLTRVHEAGDIDFREYEGLYCVGCERFLTDRDLVDGRCADHERAPEPRREGNYFFRLTRYREWLAEYIRAHPDFIRPERYRNEALAMLREDSGLEDFSISRPKSRVTWGIELPFDPDHVCYVWFDALINYLTGIGYPDAPDFDALWGATQHVIAKDILKQHALFWPAMLRSMGLPPFRHLNVHGYWSVDGRKISKSLGNAVDPLLMRERYGFDAFRYFLLREMVFGVDANFTEEALVTRANADLANNLGNLLNRTLNMTERFAGGAVPSAVAVGAPEAEVEAGARRAATAVHGAVAEFKFHDALAAIVAFASDVNRYLDARAPWKQAKREGGTAAVHTTLYTAAESLRWIALLLAPFLPEAAPRILAQLGLAASVAPGSLPREDARWGALAAGAPIARGAPLFPRIERADPR